MNGQQALAAAHLEVALGAFIEAFSNPETSRQRELRRDCLEVLHEVGSVTQELRRDNFLVDDYQSEVRDGLPVGLCRAGDCH